MKKTTIISLFLLLIGALTFNACSSNKPSSSSESSTSSVNGELHDSNSLEFDPFASSSDETSEDENSSSEDTSSSKNVLPDSIVDTWVGNDDVDNTIEFTINQDGTALLESDYYTYNFNYTGNSSLAYTFECLEGNLRIDFRLAGGTNYLDIYDYDGLLSNWDSTEYLFFFDETSIEVTRS